MMKHEFERLAGREVTDEQYDAFETLYMNSNLNQQDFVKSIKQILKAIKTILKKGRRFLKSLPVDDDEILNEWLKLHQEQSQGQRDTHGESPL